MRKVFLALSLFVCLCASGCSPQVAAMKTPVTEKKVLEAIHREVLGQNNGPLFLEYRKLGLQEIADHLRMDEEHTKAHLAATNIHGYYSFRARSYPPGVEFTFYQVGLSREVHPLKTFHVNAKGVLVTQLDNLFVELENNFVFFSNYLPGEPADFVLESKDRRYYAATRIVPNPLMVEDPAHRSISVQINAPDRRHYLVYCAGLRPLREYQMTVRFEGERFDETLQSNRRGELFLESSPRLAWVQGGEGVVELWGEEFSEPLVLHFQWGF